MKLNSIDIQGFKSFPDKTILEFDKGVTAVIGPNGSGKSNIADAMRWVMGEQSVKSLRGGKMEDVIFDGTKLRKPQGYAAVTINIDNRDRTLGYAADEVAVQRRLYRSGESEYRINGTAVRLRDVNELLMDTGLGKDGYSIIGQGRVSEIVSAKSLDRREIFEEAAGIAKYRFRKTEAERKLEAAEDNLVRLRDILTELESRIGPLKEQSEKAKQYIDYSSEKKELEISLWVKTLNQLKQKLASEEDKLILAKNEYKESNDKVENYQKEADLEVDKSNQLMADIERHRDAITAITNDSSNTKTEEAVNKSNIERNNDLIKELKRDISSDDISLSGIKEHYEELKTEKQGYLNTKFSHKNKLESLSSDIKNKKLELDKLTFEGEELRLRRSAAFESIDNAKIEESTSSAILGQNQSRLGQMGSTINTCQENVSSAKKEKEDAEELIESINKELESFDNVSNAFNIKLNNRTEKLNELNRKHDEISNKSNQIENKIRILSDMTKNMDGFNIGVKLILNRAKSKAISGIIGTVSSVVNTKNDYSLAIETALGNHMQDIITENDTSAKKAINILKEEKAGRATFLPLDSIVGKKIDISSIKSMPGFVGLATDLVETDKKYEEILKFLLGKIVIAKDLDYAVVIAKKNNYGFRVVTLDGQVINAGGSMTGGYQIKSANLIGRKNEIDSLILEQKKLDNDLVSVNKEIDELNNEINVLVLEKQDKESGKQSLYEDKIRAEAALELSNKNLSAAVDQLNMVKAEADRLNSSIKELKEKTTDNITLREKLSNELQVLQDKITENDNSKIAITDSIKSLENVYNEENNALLLIEKDINNISEKILGIEKTLDEHNSKQVLSKDKISELERTNKELLSEIERLKEQRTNADKQVEALNALIEQKSREQNLSQQRQTELRNKEREETAKKEKLREDLAKLESKNQSALEEQNTIINKLFEEYELTRTDAEEIAKPIEDEAKSTKRLNELKNKIKSLGPVNVEAIEEYKEVYERHYDFSRRLSDIEKSKSELLKLINELTIKMSDIFKDKFQAINQNFGYIFKELFEGGSAELVLTDPSNMLESGIEIMVHPPGKIIKNLASLSGGEQSFIAICIFFAILKVNPAPFCLMDEVESALDEVNVSKFASYLHNMTDKTQFITITHRRGTMESADILYGVTMQEEGVSKLLKLNINEIEATLNSEVHKRK